MWFGENARRFAEDELGDPADLWEKIIAIRRWDSDAVWRRYGLHRFPAGHKRVRRIGKEIVEHYQGDARKIWKDQLDRPWVIGHSGEGIRPHAASAT